MKKDLAKLTLTEAIALIDKREVTASEIWQAVEKNVETQNKNINAFLTLNESYVEETKKAAQLPLRGLPISVKDNFCTRGLRTTASSTLLDTFVPQFESTVTARLKNAGGVINGKVNLDAWAHGSSTETSQYGRTLNPRNTDYLPGGSSGGSAASVAADMCLASIGSETAGSIRQPSAWCGTVGLKPTYGRVSRLGVAAMASSTDSPGPITKCVADAALILNHIAGHDDRDATSSSQKNPDFTQAIGKEIKGVKIGVLYTDLMGLDRNVVKHFLDAVKVLEDLGAEVELASSMDPRLSIGVYTVVQRAEVSSNLARYTGVRYGKDRSHFGAEAKRRIMLGTFTLSKGYADQYYVLAQKVRTQFIQDYERLFKKYDVLVSLSSPGFAKKVGATEGAAMFGELEDLLLEPSSIIGLPGVGVPCYHDQKTNLFLGMNIMAPMWHESNAIQVGYAFEQATNWNTWLDSSK